MILMLQIFDVTANENARYKRNELELPINAWFWGYYALIAIARELCTSQSNAMRA